MLCTALGWHRAKRFRPQCDLNGLTSGSQTLVAARTAYTDYEAGELPKLAERIKAAGRERLAKK